MDRQQQTRQRQGQGPPPMDRQSYQQAAAEALNRPIEYDPAIRAQYIRSMLNDIPKMLAEGKTEDEIKAATGDFAEKYPHFFQKLMAREDLQPIWGMVNMLEKMATGEINQHQASVVVGKQLYNKYVEPQLRRN